jgi:hypothetical protein
MKNKSKYSLLVAVFIITSFINQCFAQKKYFIYIQAEDKQPFYVMINKKNYSSSINGHLVIPKLKNGKYFFVAGFPKDKYPEQKFTCVVEDKDQGFVLKQYGSDGWGLFNVVTFKSTMSNAKEWEKEKSVYDTITIEDDIAIAPVVKKQVNSGLTSLEKSTEAVKESYKEATLSPPPKYVALETEKNEFKSQEEIQPEILKENQKLVNNHPSSIKRIVRTLQKGSAQGLDEIYVDYTVSPSDTIALFIPLEKNVQNEVATTTQIPIIDSIQRKRVGNANQYNTSCVYLATETDYAKTRKLMSLETTDDKMIATAKKTFKGKCFTVDQIKNLGLLFLAEQNRLKFFTNARTHVYDTLNFVTLETQFTLSSIIEQFRKLNN